jgi:hypothetical protein
LNWTAVGLRNSPKSKVRLPELSRNAASAF